jgi:hypothetical protein
MSVLEGIGSSILNQFAHVGSVMNGSRSLTKLIPEGTYE